MEFLPGWEPLT